MNKIKTGIVLLLVSMFHSLVFAEEPEFHIQPANELYSWGTVGPAGFTTHIDGYNELAMDNNNIPYIVYKDSDDYGPNVMKYDAPDWNHVGNDTNLAAYEIYDMDIAFDSSNNPYVVFTDSDNDYKVAVYKFDGVNWSMVGGTEVSAGDNDNYCVIAIDTTNMIYVAYKDSSNSDKITVKKYNGSSWSTVGSAGFAGGDFGVKNISIALDSYNAPYVAFHDRGGSSGGDKGMVMKFNGINWVDLGSLDIDHPKLAIDSSNKVYVTSKYTDRYSSLSVKTFVDSNSSWVYYGEAEFSPMDVDDVSIVIDSADIVYVGYSDTENEGKQTVMKYNGSSWVNVGKNGFSTGNTSINKLAIGSNDIPYVFYNDVDPTSGTCCGAIVMKFDKNIKYEIIENNTTVGDINATDSDGNTISYSLSDSLSDGDSALFNISSTGALSFHVAPNYEVPTDKGADNIYNVKVWISANGDWVSKDVQITVVNDTDEDNDGVDEITEAANGTDPNDADTDDDGLSDSEEITATTNPLDADTDDDGLSDGEEIILTTNPLDSDHDDDNLTDGLEVGKTDPISSGISDVHSIPYVGTALGWIPDSDDSTTTDPLLKDTDEDTLNDGIEDLNLNGAVDSGETDPDDADSDGDTVRDDTDVCIGYDDLGDPDNDTLLNNVDPDDDGDGMSDVYELQYSFDPIDPSDAGLDADIDGFTNLEEYNAGTNPRDDQDKPVYMNPAIIMYLLH